MIKLYGGTFSRASIVKWYLEELQIPYEFVLVDLAAGEQLQPNYLAIHPFAKVPAIVDGNFVLWETGAILTYLSGKYDPTTATPEQLAIVNQWVIFANTTLSDGLFNPKMQAKETPHLLGKLEAIALGKPYLLGSQISAADVMLASFLSYAFLMVPDFDLSAYPNLSAYLQQMRDRPAFKSSMAMPG
jgi:glutathione S-transferase